MATNIEELFDARRRLVAWASHDLRTPLASLRAMAGDRGRLGSSEEDLPAIHGQLQALSSRIDDLFELALHTSGSAPVIRDRVLSDRAGASRYLQRRLRQRGHRPE
jgi:signal transduction histidine kinase